MYPFVLWCHLICHVAVFIWILAVNCLKNPKKPKETKSSKVLQTTPIVYETDPAVLEKERKQKVAENRARMKKKREKKAASRIHNVVENHVVEEPKKAAQLDAPKIPEEPTQPMNSDEIVGTTARPIAAEKSQDTLRDECQKVNSLVLGTEEEEKLGDVKLVDNDPNAAWKTHQIKKKARDAAKKKQTEEAIMRRLQAHSDPTNSPDDTLKNVSSIQFESQLSVIQKKRQKMEEKSLLQGMSSEEHTKTAELVDAKSSHLYANLVGNPPLFQNLIMRLTILALILIEIVNAASAASATSDWSLREICAKYKGVYTERSNGAKAATGDKCQMKFTKGTRNDAEALKFCEQRVPYHIIGAKSGEFNTECHAEATLVCKPEWVQMYGRCYKLKRELMKREAAEKYCKDESATIAFLHRHELAPRWRAIYPTVDRVWLTASEVYMTNLVYDHGPNLVLAFTPNQFGSSRFNSLAKVPKETEAMALCEYTPPMNFAESNYVLRKYGEIYHPPVVTTHGVHMRTASYLHGIADNKLKDSLYCEKLMKPFFGTVPVQSAIPTKEFIDELAKSPLGKETIIRTSIHSNDAKLSSRSNLRCAESGIARNYGYDHYFDGQKSLFQKADSDVWAEDQPAEKCDGGTWSTGIALSRTEPGLETMSDARFGPIFCQPRFETRFYSDCPKDYTAYVRTNGQKWCHKFVKKSLNYTNAANYCEEEGAFISGYDSQDELKKMQELFAAGRPFEDDKGRAWIGANRRVQCTIAAFPEIENKGFVDSETSPCSRVRAMEWSNGVATNPPDFLPNWITQYEPNSAWGSEDCVELLDGKVGQWEHYNIRDGTMKLNDIACDKERYFFCGKEADIETKVIEF